jgi:hypothetical protein
MQYSTIKDLIICLFKPMKARDYVNIDVILLGLFEKNPYLEVKQNGSAPFEPKDDPIKAVPQKPGELKGPLSKLDPRYNNQAKSAEEKAKEDKAREDKAREEKVREEKLKEERAREEKAKEEKAREEKLKEEKAKEAKGREDKTTQEQRGRSKTDEDARIKVDARVMSATPPPYIAKSAVGGI